MNTQTINRRVGILGGMGPEATVLLMSRVIEKTEVNDDSDHVSMIVDNNTQIPSRIKALIEKTGRDPRAILKSMARGLELSGAEALAMPCNTAHYYAADIDNAVNIPLLNIVKLAAERIQTLSPTVRRIGILASPAVKDTHVFNQTFESCNIDIIYPANQRRMLGAIRALKINSSDVVAIDTLQKAGQELTNNGADCLLIACSEFSIITELVQFDIPYIDTIDVLAEKIIEFSGAKLKNNKLIKKTQGAATKLKIA